LDRAASSTFGKTSVKADFPADKRLDGHAASPRNLIAAVGTGSLRSSGAAAHVVRALSCEFSGFGGLGASALSLVPTFSACKRC
jgi:hypothetical protein